MYAAPPTTPNFAAALRDIRAPRPETRAKAATVLGDARNEEERSKAFSALAEAVGDAQPQVRSSACFSLAELQREDAWELIALGLSDEFPEVRQSAAIALGNMEAAPAFEVLATALREGPVDLRFQAATSLAEVAPDRAYEPLVAALDDTDAEVLSAVVLSLGALGNAACADQIAELLDHKVVSTRLDAAYALADFGDQRALPTLAAALADPQGGWDASVALEKLGQSALPAFEEFLQGKSTTPILQLRAASVVLGHRPDHAAARDCFVAALASRKLDVRGLAIQELCCVGGEWAVPPLRALSKRFRARKQREEIAAAIAEIGERLAEQS